MCQDTIHKCFRKAGVLVASALSDSADPFSDLDDDLELEYLIGKVYGGTEWSPVTELVGGDDCLQICREFGEDWDKNYLFSSSKQVNGSGEEVVEEPSDEDESDHEELCANPISSIKEAITAVENVHSYLEQ